MTEVEALAKLKGYAAKNQIAKSYIGMGYHDTHVPHVILRNVLENPGWYTACTPISPSWPRAVSKPCSTSSSSPWISPAWIWRAPPCSMKPPPPPKPWRWPSAWPNPNPTSSSWPTTFHPR